MKKVLCVTAVFALAVAPAAFGQMPDLDDNAPQSPIYVKTPPTQTPESMELLDLIYKELDTSRVLRRVEMNNSAIELDAPLKMVKSEDGKKLTVTYDITGSRGSSRTFTATCTPTQLERCADAIVLRAERMSRELVGDSRVFQ